jgi:iron-sulfur cluster assembly protein
MGKAPEGAIGVKLSTRRGCSGLATRSIGGRGKQVRREDRNASGIFYVDGASIYLVGSVMDWRDDDFAAGFVFPNPNARGLRLRPRHCLKPFLSRSKSDA